MNNGYLFFILLALSMLVGLLISDISRKKELIIIQQEISKTLSSIETQNSLLLDKIKRFENEKIHGGL